MNKDGIYFRSKGGRLSSRERNLRLPLDEFDPNAVAASRSRGARARRAESLSGSPYVSVSPPEVIAGFGS
jgi:hypothetical protein